jgi:single-stranded-DNA-specific exonuclease
VLLLASSPGELARGSARSIAGVNITAAIAEQKDLLANFGGHPMAAGLSIEAERLPELRHGLIHTIRRMTGGVLPASTLQIDGYLTLPELSLELAEDLQRLAPFGPGNPALTLVARNLSLVKFTPIGRGDEHLQLVVEDEQGNSRQVLWWQGGSWLPTIKSTLQQGRFDLAFTLRASDYRGARDIQVEWLDARLLEAVELAEPAPQIEVQDYRRQDHPLAALKQLAAEREIQVWGEAEAVQKLSATGIGARSRQELTACRVLAIWTTPPGPAELKVALEKSTPEVVYLFGVDPETADQNNFLKRLAGLVIYALNHRDGQVELASLAAATAHSELTVRKGLDWLAVHGDITIVSEGNDQIKLGPGSKIKNSLLEQVSEALKTLLAETAAYRAYFQKADKVQLIGMT